MRHIGSWAGGVEPKAGDGTAGSWGPLLESGKVGQAHATNRVDTVV